MYLDFCGLAEASTETDLHLITEGFEWPRMTEEQAEAGCGRDLLGESSALTVVLTSACVP